MQETSYDYTIVVMSIMMHYLDPKARSDGISCMKSAQFEGVADLLISKFCKDAASHHVYMTFIKCLY